MALACELVSDVGQTASLIIWFDLAINRAYNLPCIHHAVFIEDSAGSGVLPPSNRSAVKTKEYPLAAFAAAKPYPIRYLSFQVSSG